jgi:hypothetical protein
MPKIDNTLVPASGGAFVGDAASTIGPFPVTTTSANAPISGLTNGRQVRIANTGGAGVRIAFGTDNTIVATTPAPGTLASARYTGGTAGSKLIAAGAVEVLGAPAGAAFIAFKTDAGTSTIEFTPGEGV